MKNSKKPEVRIQTSILNKLEKRVLVWMALRIPTRIKSDHLTALGFIGALISSAGYMLSNLESNFLWLASFGLVLNWFGDSLDGTLARVRNAQRPIYGFFIDHNIDGLTVLAICIGAGLSPFINFSTAMLILASYLLLSVFTYINTYLNGEFRITYHKLGPTEFRLIVILINTLFIYYPAGNQNYIFNGVTISIFDAIGIVIAIILFIFYMVNFLIDKNKYAKIDPLKY
jgi:phosphatidylglycerophosphate synthase